MNKSSYTARGFGDAIDIGVATLAAVSVAFVTYAMPDDLFESLVRATHLGSLVAAAAPPLGATARYGAMGAGAVAIFLVTWSLLRALEGKSAHAKAEVGAPRLRRADAHPDAPARRPLFAGADLGDPYGDEEEDDIYELDSPAYSEPEPEPIRAAPQSACEPEPRFGRARFQAAEAPEIERDPIVPASQKQPYTPVARAAPEPEPQAGTSIGKLMQRLERGLSDREEPKPAAAAPEPFEPEVPAPLAAAAADPEASLSSEGVRHRLRSAISDLNQVANRG